MTDIELIKQTLKLQTQLVAAIERNEFDLAEAKLTAIREVNEKEQPEKMNCKELTIVVFIFSLPLLVMVVLPILLDYFF